MKIAIASGKGGTGKTTVATNLAFIAAQIKQSVGYIDADVEEPNGAIFLRPTISETKPVEVSIPEINPDKCTGCGLCEEICEFNALVVTNNKPKLFPELCHGCGGCWYVCPTHAITKSSRRTGRVEIGHAGSIQFVQGILDIGEVMSPSVIEATKSYAPATDWSIIDCPPGTSCPVIECMRGADFTLLVTEPTPFGLNDLQLAVEMTRVLQIPFAVIVNRSGQHDGRILDYCRKQEIQILGTIADDRRIAEEYSRGELICDALPEYTDTFTRLFFRIAEYFQTIQISESDKSNTLYPTSQAAQ